MSKQEKVLWVLFTGILVFLFLLSSTDLIIKEKKVEIHPVSVIIGDTTDDYYLNFRKGVEMAADEYNVDVSFITLYEKGDTVQQMELVKREIDGGAGAVILMPVNPEECGRELDKMVVNSPLIIMGTMLPNDRVKYGISFSHREAGQKLGEAIVKDYKPDTPVYVFTEGLEYSYDQEVYDGLVSVLSEAGFETKICRGDTEDAFQKIIEETISQGEKGAVITALDVSSLEAAAELMDGNSRYKAGVFGLYGMGSTAKILNQLDSEIIRGIVVSNQFDAGYLAVEKAVTAIKRTVKREQITLDSYYIEREDIRKSQFEKILYPID